jgi:hypothetical protein
MNRESWLIITRGEGDEENILTVAAEPSLDPVPRYDTLIIYPVNEAFYALADTIPVVQEAGDMTGR